MVHVLVDTGFASRIQAGAGVVMRSADCGILNWLMKAWVNTRLAVLENLPHGYFERSGWVSGVGKGLADFRLPVPKETSGENAQFSQRQMQYQRF